MRQPGDRKHRETTLTAELAIDLIRFLIGRAFRRMTFAARSVLTPRCLAQPNARIPGSVMERVWEHAITRTGDADLGLHAAEAFNPGALNILGTCS